MTASAAPPVPRRVGVAISTADREIFPLVAAALARRGVEVVVRLDLPDRPAPDRLSRLLLAADRFVSRWLPGSVRPTNTASDAPGRTGLKIEEGLTDGLAGEAVLIVGPSPSPRPAAFDGADLYHLEVGASRPGFPEVPGAFEVLTRRGVAILRLSPIGRSTGGFRGGEMAVQAHLRSIHRTGSTLLASLPDFLDVALRPGANASVTPPRQAGPTAPVRPGPTGIARHLTGLAFGLAERVLFRFQWGLAAMPAPRPGQAPDWAALRPTPQPADRIWADPFLVRRDGRNWLFFEDAPFISDKGADIGHLSVVEIDRDGRLVGDPVVVLDTPSHLSYPNVFEHDGEWYLLPETGSLGRIELYRCTRWPDGWERHSTLVEDYQGYDASIVQSGDHFWMFVARRAKGVGTTDFLDLFSAASPLGPWTPHPQSPVVQDVRSARPGGRILRLGDRLVRPAQDSSGGLYGRALRLQDVTRLDESGFKEDWGAVIEPNPRGGVIGVHSLAWNEEVIVIDICRRIPRLRLLRGLAPSLRLPLVIETAPDQ